MSTEIELLQHVYSYGLAITRTRWPRYWKLVKIVIHSWLVNQWYHYAIVDILDPPWMVPPLTSNMCKVFGNLCMPWMGTWIHHLTNTLVRQKKRRRQPAELLATAGPQMMPLCNVWGSWPTFKWSSLYIEHIQGVWQTSQAVDIHTVGHHNITTALVGADIESWYWKKSFITAGW